MSGDVFLINSLWRRLLNGSVVPIVTEIMINHSNISSNAVKIWDTKAFMERYFHYTSFKLLGIDFKTNDGIYNSVNLTPANFEIFRLACELIKAATITKMRVSNGVLTVQLVGSYNFRSISSILERRHLLSNSV